MNTATTGAPAGAAPGRRGNDLFDARFPLLQRITKRHVDIAVWFIWLAVTIPLPVPMITVVRYACAAYFAAGLILHPRELLPTLGRGWPLFILPILMLISASWAPAPNEAIRKSIMFVLTAIIPTFLATRLTARQIMFGLIVMEGIAGGLSLLRLNFDYVHAATGIFGQKNTLAIHMFFLFVAGMAFFLDNKLKLPMRAIGFVSMMIAFVLIVLSKSGTTLLVSAVAAALLFGHAIIWQPAKRVRHMRSLIVMLVITLVLIASFALLAVLNLDLQKTFLGVLGKDSTLTGRTWLWDLAKRTMEQNPWGVGAEGFWRPELGEANTITRNFHFSSFTRFSFHNTYLEIGVELGYIGMYATIGLVAWAFLSTLRNWLRTQTHYNAFFLVMAISEVIRCNAEVDLALELNTIAILFYIGALRRDTPLKAAAPPPQPAPFEPPANARPYGSPA
jgi:exopolysaccharide production protein ExoQ